MKTTPGFSASDSGRLELENSKKEHGTGAYECRWYAASSTDEKGDREWLENRKRRLDTVIRESIQCHTAYFTMVEAGYTPQLR